MVMCNGQPPTQGDAVLLFLLVFFRLGYLVLLAGMLVAWGTLFSSDLAAGVWLFQGGSSSFLLGMFATARAHMQAHLGACWQKCLGVLLWVRQLTLGLVFLFLLWAWGGRSSFHAARSRLLHLIIHEPFAAFHVLAELLPSYKHLIQTLPAPIVSIVVHADNVIEVRWVIAAWILIEWAEWQLLLGFTIGLSISLHL